MNYQFIPYHIFLLLSLLILMTLAVYGFKHRAVRGARLFTICMLIGIIWILGNGLEISAINLNAKLFWANIQYIAYAFAPVVWLLMILQFTDRASWISKKNIFIMSIIPIITIILVWTDYRYGLVRNSFIIDSSGAFPVISKDYGPWFWVHFSYCYLLNLATIIFLFRTLLLKNTVYRKQSFYLLIGFMIISITNIIYVAGLSPVESIDFSPISFTISGIIIGWGIFHFQLFNLVPVARETVIEKMGSGILVIDKMQRIIDINPQAEEILDLNKKIAGHYLKLVLPQLYKEVDDYLSSPAKSNELLQKEFVLNKSDINNNINVEEENKITEIKSKNKQGVERIDSYYELYISPIFNYQEEHIAWVIILNDISNLKLAREQIYLQQQELAVMDERERMSRDLHDNLGQVLSFSSIQIQTIRQELKKGNHIQANQYLLRLNQIVKEAHKDIREYVYNIRDNSIYDKEITLLLKEQIEEFKRLSKLEVKVIFDNYRKLSALGTEEKMQLIHITKEALNNILKYAEADSVKVSLFVNEKTGELSIEDNGKGINTGDNISPEGSGLSIMNERARLINGKLKIESAKSKGTKIICKFPVEL